MRNPLSACGACVRRLRSAVLVAAALGLTGGLAAADVLVVDASGGGDYTTLPAAVTAAVDGDVVLVRAGYANAFEFTLVQGKAIAIVADTGARPVLGLVRIAGTTPGGVVLLRGLDLQYIAGATLELMQQAEARVEDCTLRGIDGTSGLGTSTYGSPAATVADSRVVFSRCTITGGDGIDANPPYSVAGNGGRGVDAYRSRVVLEQCVLNGGQAGDYNEKANPGPGGDGGAGISGYSCQFLAEGCTITGGDGGDGTDGNFNLGYRGGDAIELSGGTGLEVRLRDDTLTGGQPGQDDNGNPGNPGLSVDAPGGVVFNYAGTARAWSVDGPTRDGGNARFTYQGDAGDRLALLVSLAPAHVPLGAKGDWLVGPLGLAPVYLGKVTDPAGALTLDVSVGPLGLGPGQGFVLFEQVLVLDPTGELLLGSPTGHAIVDDTY